MHGSEEGLFWLLLPGSRCPAHSAWVAPWPLMLQTRVLSGILALAHRNDSDSYCLLLGDAKMSKRAGEMKTDWEMTGNRRWGRSRRAAGWLITFAAKETFELKLWNLSCVAWVLAGRLCLESQWCKWDVTPSGRPHARSNVRLGWIYAVIMQTQPQFGPRCFLSEIYELYIQSF